MTCANCVAAVERNLKKEEGVLSAEVNFATETADVIFNTDKVALPDLVSRVKRAGYGVAMGELELRLESLSDISLANALKKRLTEVPGIVLVEIDTVEQSVNIMFLPTELSVQEIKKSVETWGYTILSEGKVVGDVEQAARLKEIGHKKHMLKVGLLFTVPLFIISMSVDLGLLPHSLMETDWYPWLLFALSTPVQFYVGWQFHRGAYNALRNGAANMDVLISMGSSAAYFASVFALIGAGSSLYFETSATIITLISFGKVLEAGAKGKTNKAVRKLLEMAPQQARVIRNSEELEIPIEEIIRGDIVVVRAGEKFPVDGVVTRGEGMIDEAMLTGEPIAVLKKAGDKVVGSTLNRTGWIEYEVTHTGEDTVLAQIIRMVRDAQRSKAPIQSLADRISAIFVPVVVGVALVTFIGWLVASGINAEGFQRALINMVAVLVISCPCAMGLATPTAIVVGMGEGARRGILFRSSAALELTGSLDTVILDKTGTLTEGKPSVTDIVVLDNSLSSDDVLLFAAQAEIGSAHPLGEAVLNAARERGLSLVKPDRVATTSGAGIEAVVEGRIVLVGSSEFIASHQVEMSVGEHVLADLMEQGKTTAVIAVENRLVGVLGIADEVKEGSFEAVKLLQKQGLKLSMLTGDHHRAAVFVAEQVGIKPDDGESKSIISGVKPEGKKWIIEEAQENGRIVAMVGDGINDAPALAKADVGVALGTGTDVAIAAAPVTIIGSDLRAVPKAVSIARRTLKIIRENLFWAFFYNVILIPVAAFGLLNPMLAAAAMALSDVFVISNSLRLKRMKF
ncbi:MAG: heavy metal translocating P-type ATPase [Anaerolineales bacterium]|nr:heavy metal translocating P-type ATPase [Anaerolineales bacterium]